MRNEVNKRVKDDVKKGDIFEGEVFKITSFGAFVKSENGKKGLIHISQVSDDYVKKIEDHLKIGDKVSARVIKVSTDGKIDLTLKAEIKEKNYPKDKEFKNTAFSEKLDKFLENLEETASLK